MSYRIEIKRSARKALAGLGESLKRRIDAAIVDLAANPRPHGCVKLAGYDNHYRIRVGDYRIVYEVDDVIRLVAIQAVAHRRDVYRDL